MPTKNFTKTARTFKKYDVKIPCRRSVKNIAFFLDKYGRQAHNDMRNKSQNMRKQRNKHALQLINNVCIQSVFVENDVT